MKKKRLPARKNDSSLWSKCILIAVIVLLILFEGYKQFAIWDASTPTDDHSWYNLLIFPLTPTISDQTANAGLSNKNIVYIDVRPPSQYAAGHIPAAINIPEETLNSVIPGKYSQNTTIYMNCNTGHMGAVSTRLLRSMGYDNAWNISGGLGGWQQAGYQTVQ